MADVGAAHGESVAVVVDGEGGGTWFVQRGQDGWAMTTDVARPTTTIGIDPDTLWRLCTPRGITPAQAKEKVVLHGDTRARRCRVADHVGDRVSRRP